MDSNHNDPEDRVNDRVDLDRAVQLKFRKFQDFLNEVAANISPGGMFVKTDTPQPPGEQFEFECSLADGFPLVSGRAGVVWVREQALSPSEPAGMGVQFLELYENSAELIEKIIEQRVQAGEETFDLDRASSPDVASAEEEVVPEAGWLDDSPQGPMAPPVEPIEPPHEPEAPFVATEAEILAATERLVEVSEEEVEPFASPHFEAEASEETQPIPSPVPKPHPQPRTRPAERTDSPRTQDREQAPPEIERAVRWSPIRPPEIRLPKPTRAEPVPAEVSKPGVAVAPAPSGVARVKPSRTRITLLRLAELSLFSLLVGSCMVLAFNQYWVRPRIESLEGRLEDLTGSSRIGGAPGRRWVGDSEESAGTAAPASEGDRSEQEDVAEMAESEVQAAPPAVEPPDSSVETAELVRNWADAWSGRRVEEYLSYYSAAFTPASGVSRETWEARRRDRLANQGSIRVAVVSMDVVDVSPNERQVTFTQSYRSDTFRDRVRKMLRLAREDGGWKIAEEIVIRQLPW